MRTNQVISRTVTSSPKSSTAGGNPLSTSSWSPAARSLGVSPWSLEPWLMRWPKQFGVPGVPTGWALAAAAGTTSASVRVTPVTILRACILSSESTSPVVADLATR